MLLHFDFQIFVLFFYISFVHSYGVFNIESIAYYKESTPSGVTIQKKKTNTDGIIETNYGRATNSSYDTAYVLCSKTHDSYINLIYDEVDLIFCAAPSDEEIEEARTNNRELILTPIGKEAFVFFVNSKNKIDNLSKENIKDIYTVKINNWKVLGGDNMKIKAYQRNKYSGSQSAFI